jgi:hypothetical protein
VNALAIALVVCAVMVAGCIVGIVVRRRLPESHLDSSTRDVVRLGCALVATMSGVVLGMLTTAAKANYDVQRDEIRALAAQAALLDWLLTKYGPEAATARVQLRQALAVMVERIWNDGTVGAAHLGPMKTSPEGETVYESIRALAPGGDLQKHYRDYALQSVHTVLQARLTLYHQSDSAMPELFLVVLVFWLFVLFASFSLFSPINATAFVALALIALCVSGAIFVILELYQPFGGLMQIHSDMLRNAVRPLKT